MCDYGHEGLMVWTSFSAECVCSGLDNCIIWNDNVE
jgi:hypothetical protein